MLPRVVVVIVFAVVGTVSRPAAAQSHTEGRERRGAIYVSALGAVPWSQGLTEDGYQTYVLPPGGFSLGWSLLGGLFVAPEASLEFEVSRTGTVSRVQPSRYDTTYTYGRRDTFFSGGLRFHAYRRRAIDLEPVVAIDIIREEQWDTRDRRSTIPGIPSSHEGPYHSTLPTKAGWSAGVDVRLGAGRAAFVASFRVRHTSWGETSDFGNTKQWTLVPAAGLRLTF